MFPTRFSCGAVVYRLVEGSPQILLVKQAQKDESWGIPKGHMERDETYMETAVRETKEEAGIDIRIITQLPHVVLQKRNFRKIVVPFLAIQTCDKEPCTDHESSEVVDARWFNVKTLPQIFFYQRPILDAALMLLEMKKDG